MIRRFAAVAALAAALAVSLVLPQVAAQAIPGPMTGRCSQVVIAFRTVTGHEADMPVTFCGGMRAGSWACQVTPPGPLLPGARLLCSRAPRP